MKNKIFLLLIIVLSIPSYEMFGQVLKFNLGIHRPNLTWVGSLVQEKAIIDKMAVMAAKSVRLNPREGADGDFNQQVLYANSKGMKVDVELPVFYPAFFPIGTVQRTAGIHWASRYKLSDLDPSRYKLWLSNFLDNLKAIGADVEIFEFGNEFNWIDFNGDMPEVVGGKYFDYNTPWDDPQYVQIRQGIDKYGQILKIIREELDRVWGKDNARLMTGGMVSFILTDWAKYNSASILAPNMWLDLLRGTHPKQTGATNYLQYVNEYGIHLYPSTVGVNYAQMKAPLSYEIRTIMDALVSIVGYDKPFWVTEWGYQRNQFTSEEDRYTASLNFLLVCNTLPYNWQTMYLYTFDGQTEYNAYENNAYLPVSKIFNLESKTALPNNISDSKEVNIFPNPFNDSFNISFDNHTSYNSLKLFDVTGKQLYYRNLKRVSNETVNISIDNLKTGVYIIELNDNKNQNKNYKISKI